MIICARTGCLRISTKLLRLMFTAMLWAGGTSAAQAADWVSLTWDNDMFLGSDDGYTSGIFMSWFDLGQNSAKTPEPSFMVSPLLWSLGEGEPVRTANAHSIGQIMVTPDNIIRRVPDPDDLPYSGLLYYLNSHMRIYDDYADKVSTTVGLIGPDSGAESTQEFIHELIDSDQPQGWDSQLGNEVAFRFSRDRTWRVWVSSDQPKADLLTLADINIGTLETSVGTSVMFRYGRGLLLSYPTAAFRGNRSINPLAVEGGWNVYLGLGVRYIAHVYYADGNTFRDSPSVNYKRVQVGASFGISHSWQNAAITMAIEDMFLLEDRYEDIARYATITFAYKL
jgi:lipid A 3-O-deacylase